MVSSGSMCGNLAVHKKLGLDLFCLVPYAQVHKLILERFHSVSRKLTDPTSDATISHLPMVQFPQISSTVCGSRRRWRPRCVVPARFTTAHLPAAKLTLWLLPMVQFSAQYVTRPLAIPLADCIA
eukprot:scpid22249/ scgid10732/ 